MADNKPTAGQNWSRVAKIFAAVVDTSDALNPAGAAYHETMAVVDATLPFSKATFIVDMGCGNGTLIGPLLDSQIYTAQIPDDARIVAVDVAEGLLEMLRTKKSERSKASPTWDRLEVQNWDAKDLGSEIKDGQISHLISSYAYYTFREENKALAEAHRVLQSGGIFVTSNFLDAEWLSVPTRHLKEVRPGIQIPGPGSHWNSADGVKKTLQGAGFASIQTKEYNCGITFETHEDEITFIFEGMPFVKPLTADWSEEEIARTKDGMMKDLRKKHPEKPYRSMATAIIAWATK